jgi:hypothetical protein
MDLRDTECDDIWNLCKPFDEPFHEMDTFDRMRRLMWQEALEEVQFKLKEAYQDEMDAPRRWRRRR